MHAPEKAQPVWQHALAILANTASSLSDENRLNLAGFLHMYLGDTYRISSQYAKSFEYLRRGMDFAPLMRTKRWIQMAISQGNNAGHAIADGTTEIHAKKDYRTAAAEGSKAQGEGARTAERLPIAHIPIASLDSLEEKMRKWHADVIKTVPPLYKEPKGARKGARKGADDFFSAAELMMDGALKLDVWDSPLQYPVHLVRGLRAKPWWTAADSTELSAVIKMLEDNFEAIRKEGKAVVQPPQRRTDEFKGELRVERKDSQQMEAKGWNSEHELTQVGGDWKQFILSMHGDWNAHGNRQRCSETPFTCKLLQSKPIISSCRVGQVKFSTMLPGTHVRKHAGPTNTRLRLHLPLFVPEAEVNVTKPPCRIQVGAEKTRTWKEGKVLAFDDSFQHEVWQEANAPRLVLIVDMWHPDLSNAQKEKIDGSYLNKADTLPLAQALEKLVTVN